MGWMESQDHLNSNIKCLLVNIQGLSAMMDDFLVFANGLNEAYSKTLQLLINAVMHGWVFSRRKMRVSTDVNFCGLALHTTSEGNVVIQPTKDRLAALLDFPSPQSKKEVKSLVGLLNTFSKHNSCQ